MPFRVPRPLRRLVALVTWDARDTDMDQEMAHHLESLTRDLMQSGMNEADAVTEARRRFGSVLRLKETGHDQRRAPLVEDLVRDARYVVRGLRRSPVFATTVVLTLALGSGGNTAIFSVVDQLLLRPLPYPQGDQLLTVYERLDGSTFGSDATADRNVVSPANWLDWKRESTTLQDIAAWLTVQVALTGVGEPLQLNGQIVSSEFFRVLDVPPLLGRVLTEADDRPNAPQVIVLSHRFWQQRLSADPNVIGRIVQLNARPVEIVGVMPESFRFVYQDTDLWGAARINRDQDFRNTSGRFLFTVARLKPGATMAAARSDLEAIAARLAEQHEFNRRTGVTLVPLREELTGQVHTSLWMLYGAVAVLLSIACFNVANLLLARATSRSREFALRTSLGAGRLSIVRQLLVESVLLAVVGGLLGVALARWSLDALVTFAPAELLRVPELTIDRRILIYALGMSTLTGVIVGLAPALLVAGQSIALSLRSGGTTVTHAPRVRQALVVCQVAMTVVLLCGAALLVRTVVALNGTNDGFDKRSLLTMSVSLPPARYNPEQRVTFYRAAVEAMRAIPGVESAAAGNSLPVIGSPRGGTAFHRRGTPELPMSQRPAATIRVVTPGYFETLRVPVRQGREFTDADTSTAGFVVNEAFVNTYLARDEALGVEMSVWMQAENPYLPIIGVVGDVSEGSVRDGAEPTIFYSERTMPEAGMTLFVRTPRPAATIDQAIAAIRRLDANLPVTKVQTFERALAESLARERLNAMVSGAFAVSGLLLAALGLYGLLAFIVAERTKEIAIRIALGAHARGVTGAVVGRGLKLVAIGAAAGVAGSALLLRPLRALLFEVTPYDGPTYATVLGLMAVVAATASYVPARHAARVPPLQALRQD